MSRKDSSIHSHTLPSDSVYKNLLLPFTAASLAGLINLAMLAIDSAHGQTGIDGCVAGAVCGSSGYGSSAQDQEKERRYQEAYQAQLRAAQERQEQERQRELQDQQMRQNAANAQMNSILDQLDKRQQELEAEEEESRQARQLRSQMESDRAMQAIQNAGHQWSAKDCSDAKATVAQIEAHARDVASHCRTYNGPSCNTSQEMQVYVNQAQEKMTMICNAANAASSTSSTLGKSGQGTDSNKSDDLNLWADNNTGTSKSGKSGKQAGAPAKPNDDPGTSKSGKQADAPAKPNIDDPLNPWANLADNDIDLKTGQDKKGGKNKNKNGNKVSNDNPDHNLDDSNQDRNSKGKNNKVQTFTKKDPDKNYAGKECSYFTRPAVEDGARFNYYAVGARVCYGENFYQCKGTGRYNRGRTGNFDTGEQGHWEYLGRCDIYLPSAEIDDYRAETKEGTKLGDSD